MSTQATDVVTRALERARAAGAGPGPMRFLVNEKAKQISARGEGVAKLTAIHQVAVVSDGNLTIPVPHHKRLDIPERCIARG